MANITLEDIPEHLRAQLEREAAANFRSVSQEAAARLQRSFDLDDRVNASSVNRLIQEAMDSGPEAALTREQFDAARHKARAEFDTKNRAA
jgi:plasmid stability protein